MDFRLSPVQHIERRNVSNCAMESCAIVVVHINVYHRLRLFQVSKAFPSDAFSLQRFVPSFNFSVTLRVVWRCFHVGKTMQSDKLLKLLANKLRAIVTDDAGMSVRKTFARDLYGNANVIVFHGLRQTGHNDVSAAPVNDCRQKAMLASDSDIGDVNMPVFVNFYRLLKTISFGPMPVAVASGPDRPSSAQYLVNR